MFGPEARPLAAAARQARRRRERQRELGAVRAQRRGPAQALCEQPRRQLPTDPGSFCVALLGSLEYTLPTDVDAATWRVALGHFAQRRPAEGEFRHAEQEARETWAGHE